MSFHKACSNPFHTAKHHPKKSTLRQIQPWMVEKKPTLKRSMHIYDQCRRKIRSLILKAYELLSTSEERESVGVLEDDFEPDFDVQHFNEGLERIGESPIKTYRLNCSSYSNKKFRQLEGTLKDKVFKINNENSSEDSEIARHLKPKFDTATSFSEKLRILTIVAPVWSIRKMTSQFSTTTYLARKAKQLFAEQGIMSSPNPRPGKSLAPEVCTAIQVFYCSDEVSRLLPGKKDFLSVRLNGQRIHLQKRLVLSNLKELYYLFKANNPALKVGFSKFASLRPPNCVLAGASGTHCVCVCVVHQNLKLMVEGINIQRLTKNHLTPFSTYKDLSSLVLCKTPQEKCYFGECEDCPGTENLKEFLETLFNEHCIDEITFKQWTSTDRSQLETVVKTAEEYISSITANYPQYLQHSFITSQQSSFLKLLKEGLQVDEVSVLCDCSENFSFIVQDAVQGYHWNNAQATIHPFGFYYKIADGAAAQYKNRKNFLNLVFHQDDYGVPAEWHFFGTAHGKSICDGLGGTLKRLVSKASLQRPLDQQIINAQQLYDWAKENLHNMNMCFIDEQE